MSSQLLARGGPYASPNAGLGGIPSTNVDDPITAVFLFLFVCGAATHMTIFQMNKRGGHKFNASGALFGFCMARITACVLRLVWSTHTSNVSVAIAANVFFNAGSIIVVILNLLFAQRILRAVHPTFGWSRPVHFAYLAFFISIPCLLVALITSIVQTSYTLDTTILKHDHTIALVGTTWFTVAAFLPIPIVLVSLAIHAIRPASPVQQYGTGSIRSKACILLFAAVLVCLGSSFRAATAYMPRPKADPAWYDGKAAYYCFNFMLDVIVIHFYAAMRIDRRFWVPNGSSKVRTYEVTKPENREGSLRSGVEGEEHMADGTEKVLDDRDVV